MGNFKEDIARTEAFIFDVDGVMTDGGIIPCQSWLSSAPLGNMLTDDWASVWNSERCAAIRAESAKMDHICQLQGGNREEGARC